MSATSTDAPTAANASADARPIPEPPPVTTAVAPASSIAPNVTSGLTTASGSGQSVDDDFQRLAGPLASRDGVGRARHQHGPLVEPAEEDVGQRLDRRLADRTRLHRQLEHGGDHAQAVRHVDLAPRLPAEHRRAFKKHDALDGRLEASVEEGVGA